MANGPEFHVVRQVASYVITARSAPLSNSASGAALKCILDLFGAAIAGVNEAGPAAVRRFVFHAMPAAGEDIPVWFTSKSSSIIGAAYANSAAACALDLDDGNRMAR